MGCEEQTVYMERYLCVNIHILRVSKRFLRLALLKPVIDIGQYVHALGFV